MPIYTPSPVKAVSGMSRPNPACTLSVRVSKRVLLHSGAAMRCEMLYCTTSLLLSSSGSASTGTRRVIICPAWVPMTMPAFSRMPRSNPGTIFASMSMLVAPLAICSATKVLVSMAHFLFCAEAPTKMLIANNVNSIFFMSVRIYIKCKDTKNILYGKRKNVRGRQICRPLNT